jgi:hypothetical protein
VRTLAIWLIAIIASCLPAEARDATKFVLNGWMGSSVKDFTSGGRFSHCVAFAFFENGTTAAISVDRNYHWSLGFGISSWHFESATIPISYRFDGGPWKDAHGSARNSQFVILDPPSATSLTQLLIGRRIMEAELAGELIYVNFYNSTELISRLGGCYRQATAPRPILLKSCHETPKSVANRQSTRQTLKQ